MMKPIDIQLALKHCLIQMDCDGCPLLDEKNCQNELVYQVREAMKRLDILEKQTIHIHPGFEIYDREHGRMLTEREAAAYISEHPEMKKRCEEYLGFA